MNYEYELYHHGVKGMKWGIIRKRPKSGSKKSSARKDVKVDELDKQIYGKRGAERIAKRRAKGDKHWVAQGKETVRQALTGWIGSMIVADIVISGGQGIKYTAKAAGKGAAAAVKAGKKVVEDFISRDGAILDASGKIIRGYNVHARDVTGMFDLAIRR